MNMGSLFCCSSSSPAGMLRAAATAFGGQVFTTPPVA